MKIIKIRKIDAVGFPGEPNKDFGFVNVAASQDTNFEPQITLRISGSFNIQQAIIAQRELADAIKFAKSINPKEIEKKHKEFWSKI